MPVRRDKRTENWFFRASVKRSDGTRARISGTPGVPGPWHTLPKHEGRRSGSRAPSERRGSAWAVAATTTVTEEAPKKTINEHAERFVEIYKPASKGSEKREKHRILKTHLLPYFGGMTIDGLRQEDVDVYAQRELDRGVSVKTVNNQLAVLSTLIKYRAGERSKLRFKLAGMAGEIHAVEAADVEKLLGACEDPRYRAVILLGYEAGLRAGEIRGLQWTDIKAGRLAVRRALDKQTNEPTAPKHNKSRSILISPRLAEVLEGLPKSGLWVIAEPGGGFVTYDDLSERVNAIYTAASVVRPPKPLHCLRHTFGTVMAKRVPLPVLQRRLGHADVKTTLCYVDVDEASKDAAITAVFGRRGSHVAANVDEEQRSSTNSP